LPGGPIAFAFGAEYRTEKAGVDYDELTSSGATFLNALTDFGPPDLKVKEAYGEVFFPLLKDTMFAQELSVNLAGRVSDYNNRTGTVYAYNIQGIYAPVEDIRFRAAYATSVRAPTQGDLFTDYGQNFGSGGDPCDSANIVGNSNRAANCAAAGVPTTANAALVSACTGSSFPATLGGPFVNCIARQQTVSFLQGGNIALAEERGKSLTVGAVMKPRFVPGLTLTVDYYNIKVENLIATPSLGNLLSLCFDSPVPYGSNPYCAATAANPTGLLPRSSTGSGLYGEYAAQTGGVNFAAQRTKGIDFDIDYRKTFDNGDRVRLSVIATHVLALNNFTNILVPTLPNRQLSELGDPKWAGSFIFDYDFGDFDIRYGARFIGKQVNNGLAYETLFPYTGFCPTSGVTPNTGGINGAAVPCTAGTLLKVQPNDADAIDRKWLPNVLYHDIRLGFSVAEKFRFYAGVNNLLDRQPPLGLLGTAGGDPYDSFGRNFFLGFSANW
jgi:outer membrane receptor protein involved in Fe transport